MTKTHRHPKPGRQPDPSNGGLWSADHHCGEAESHVPAMDMYETEEWLTIELELPGLRREAIEVWVEGQTIFVTAMKGDVGPGAGRETGVSCRLPFTRKLLQNCNGSRPNPINTIWLTIKIISHLNAASMKP